MCWISWLCFYIPPVSHVLDMPLFLLLGNANMTEFSINQPPLADTIFMGIKHNLFHKSELMPKEIK